MARYSYALPDPEKGWNLWQGKSVADHGREPAEIAGKRSDLIIGVPASMGTTFAIRVPTTDSELFEDMIMAQIDKRGLGGEDTIFDYEIVSQDGGQETLLSVNVLSHEFPENLCLENAAGYAPTARIREMPEDGLVLWKEHRRLVLAARRDGCLAHVQALSSAPELGAAAAQEINLSVLSLLADRLIDENPTLTVAGNFGTDDRQTFEAVVNVPVQFENELPIDRRFSPGTRYLPTNVTRARARRKAIRFWSFVSVVLLFLYTAAGIAIWKKSETTEAQVASLKKQISILEPDVEAIRASEARWSTLQPAFDLQFFPLVQLNEVTKVMPPSGVLVREFRTEGTNVRIRGYARDVQLAFNLQKDLEANPAFSAYDWEMPRPSVDRNNTATFDIRGTPKAKNQNAGSDS
ncbi:MAG: hypothetical protein HKN23_12410 [Verrucomicrobiales bacterium]|nr:hypothetical protein [Verrucomicrobiales bacterium]